MGDGKQQCGSCGGLMAAISRQCPHCGRRSEPRTVRDRDRREPVNCPSCKQRTSFRRLGGIQIDRCDDCAGMWFDDGELEALPEALSEHDLATEAVGTLDGLRAPRSTGVREVRYLLCPVCDQAMNRRNYQQVSGIILNRCSGHGTWLDFASAKALLTVFAEGRLPEIQARARSAEADEIRRQVAQAESARLDASAIRQDTAALYRPSGGGYLIRDIIWEILDFFD
jgi:Zn-finger nucleic acid-binding protein